MTSDNLTEAEAAVCAGLGLTVEAYRTLRAAQARRAQAEREEAQAGRIAALRRLLDSPLPKREREAIAARIRLLEEFQ